MPYDVTICPRCRILVDGAGPHAAADDQHACVSEERESVRLYTGPEVADIVEAQTSEILAATMTTGALMVVAERRLQLDQWAPEHDDDHVGGELALAARSYLRSGFAASPPPSWPFERAAWKPRSRLENLVRAGALVIAEIDRVVRRDHQDQPIGEDAAALISAETER